MPYLNIEYMDGKKESIFYGYEAHINWKNGPVEIRGGDGSYRERGKVEAFPTENIRKWWTSEEKET